MTEVLHIGLTRVSGSPEAIVNALNKHSSYSAVFYDISTRQFSGHSSGVDFEGTRLSLLMESSSIVHLHQVVPLDIKIPPLKISASSMWGKSFLRQWHSEPGHFLRWGFPDVDEFMDESFPHLVLCQYHERYYPWALPVPNLMDTDKLTYIPISWPEKPILAFSPSNRFKADERRWASKGYSELIEVLQPLVDEGLIVLDVLENLPLEEVLRRKAAATFVVDEVVTGSYHRSGLEGLALGKPTFAYLDARTAASLALLTGSVDCPFLNCRVEQMPLVIRYLLEHPELITDVGERSREWMRRYYADELLVKKYTDIYEMMLSGKNPESRSKGFPKDGELFLRSGLIDLLHRACN